MCTDDDATSGMLFRPTFEPVSKPTPVPTPPTLSFYDRHFLFLGMETRRGESNLLRVEFRSYFKWMDCVCWCGIGFYTKLSTLERKFPQRQGGKGLSLFV